MGRTVLVTGASGGIGGAIARRLAAEGNALVLGCRQNRAAAEALCREIRAAGGAAVVAAGDVAEESGVQALFAAAEEQFGPVQLLVNAAGHALQRQLQDTTADEWDRLFAVHARGSFLCCRRALPAMLQARAGSIVNLASVWGQVGASCEVAYSAAKAAVIGLTRALAKEVAPSGVRVNCVAPGAIDTAMMDGFTDAERGALAAEIPLGRLGTPEEVAAAVAFLASDGAGYITGQVLGVGGGFGM